MKKEALISIAILSALLVTKNCLTLVSAETADPYLSASKSAHPETVELGDPTEITLIVKAIGEQITTRKNLDITIVLDHSYSMVEYKDGRFGEAKAAAKSFLAHLNPDYDQVSFIPFSTSATLTQALTSDFKQAKAKIDALQTDVYTNIGGAINAARQELTSTRSRKKAVKIQILLTDGWANRPLNPDTGEEDLKFCKEYAQTQARKATQDNIVIYTISLGTTNVDQDLLQQIAITTGGKHYNSPTPGELREIYNTIALNITNTIASNVILTDILPADMNYKSGSASIEPVSIETRADETTALVWNLGLLSSKETESVHFQVIPQELGYDQPANIHPDSRVTYLSHANEEITVSFPKTTVNVIFPSLSLTKKNSAKQILAPTEEVSFIINVQNLGTAKANNVYITDELPGILHLQSDHESSNHSTFHWTIGDLEAGEEKVFTYTARVDEKTQTGTYTNTAIASGLSENNRPVTSPRAQSAIEIKRPTVIKKAAEETGEVLGELLASLPETGKRFTLYLGLLIIGGGGLITGPNLHKRRIKTASSNRQA